MPRPPIDLKARILATLDHVGEMPEEASSPLAHYMLGANAAMNMRRYIMRQLSKVEHYPSVRDRHLHVLDNMMIVHLVQAFERFIKDMASVCVDRLCDRVMDNRFDKLSVKGGFLAAHFGAGSSPGRALCESDTWLNCEDINEQFKRFLRDPAVSHGPPFHVFSPNSDEFRMMSIIWQIRHTIVHNVGVITRSDAAKLKVLARKPLDSPRVLLSEWDDVRYLRVYLDQQVQDINRRVGTRLAEVLTSLHSENAALLDPQTEANEVSAAFGRSLSIGGATGVLPS